MYKLRKVPFIYRKLYKGKTQNKETIFKECGNKGAIVRCIGSVMCSIEQEYKKNLTS